MRHNNKTKIGARTPIRTPSPTLPDWQAVRARAAGGALPQADGRPAVWPGPPRPPAPPFGRCLPSPALPAAKAHRVRVARTARHGLLVRCLALHRALRRYGVAQPPLPFPLPCPLRNPLSSKPIACQVSESNPISTGKSYSS